MLEDDRQVSKGSPERLLPEGAEFVFVLGVKYVRRRFPSGDEIFLTEYGLPFAASLEPNNFWTDTEWFRRNSRRLSGSSTLHWIRTKPQEGRTKDIVLKWNRMGQVVPWGDDVEEGLPGEFNSPYEEFALVMELRSAKGGAPRRVITHRPLAIYVPAELLSVGRSGRKKRLMSPKVSSHKEVKLDILKNYAVIYEWVKGVDAAEGCKKGLLKEAEMRALTIKAAEDLEARGFIVGDNKPQHLIVRPDRNGQPRRDRTGHILYGLVDFELLARTPQREEQLRSTRRHAYLRRQKDRFKRLAASREQFSRDLASMRVAGVDYVYGPVKSTGGTLWVVGNDPSLFDYFLPERWEGTQRIRLSQTHRVYYTLTKDNIHLVWKVSKMGQKPEVDPIDGRGQRILRHGFNSPFEEFALAMELSRKGIPTVYPRAIYMGGHASELPEDLYDGSRYERHENVMIPEGSPLLRKDRDYFLIWGYWNGPDEKLAAVDRDYYESMSALHAYRSGLLNEERYLSLMNRYRKMLAEAHVEDLNLKGSHWLLSFRNSGELVEDARGEPEIRVCNFELLGRAQEP